MSIEPKWSPGPWELVEATEHHGPYVCSLFGPTVCDCYAMSNPTAASVRNGGTSFPIKFPDADANAHLIAAAPELYEALDALAKAVRALPASTSLPGWGLVVANLCETKIVLAKARGETP